MFMDENKLSYVFIVVVALALITLLVLAFGYYMSMQLEGGQSPDYKSLMGI